MLRRLLAMAKAIGANVAWQTASAPVDQPNSIVLKRWHKPDGGCPCAGHDDADLQTVRVTEDFNINGERLRFPGDRSALSGCRCGVSYWARNEEGQESLLMAPRYQKPFLDMLRPTSTVSLNGRSRGRIVLGDLLPADFEQRPESRIAVRRNRQTLGWADLCTGEIWVSPSSPVDAGVEEFLRRTLKAHNDRRRPTPR